MALFQECGFCSQRLSDVTKKLRVTALQCFVVVSCDERQLVIKNFNQLGEYNKQKQYLRGLMFIVPVHWRRNPKDASVLCLTTFLILVNAKAYPETPDN